MPCLQLLGASACARNHRIAECFGLERKFRGHLAQTPCSKRGHLQLHQVAQSNLALNVSRDGVSTTSRRSNLFQRFTTLFWWPSGFEQHLIQGLEIPSNPERGCVRKLLLVG